VDPKVRYAKNGEFNIAFQLVGQGPVDLLLSPGWVTHLDLAWEVPPLADFYRRLASFSRLILFDKRGMGLSDRISPDKLPTIEERMDDIRAVMDAAGSEQAVLCGTLGGGAMCGVFAATYPHRTLGLILYGTYSKWEDSGVLSRLADSQEAALDRLEFEWGTESTAIGIWAPTLVHDEEAARAYLRLTRASLSPGAARSYMRLGYQIDWAELVPKVAVPTLVMQRTGDIAVPVTRGRELAQDLPEARYVELPGTDHLMWVGDAAPVIAEIEAFVTAAGRTSSDAAHGPSLATVLFTDIVGSTERAGELGDQAWKALVERHHATVRACLVRHRGKEIDTAGDGFFATFDGPARAVRCAEEIVEAVGALGLRVRAGLHTGEVETIDGKAGGLAVIIGARVGALAGAGEVLASSTVRDLASGSGLRFDDRGEHELKGIKGAWHLYAARARPAQDDP